MSIKVRETALKAFRVLESISADGEGTSTEIGTRMGISRVTAYGMLETLVQAGYLYRDGPRDQYRLTNRPMLLVKGLDNITHAASMAVPVLARLTADCHWPVEFAVRSGLDMLILETSDRQSPHSIARLKRRHSVPIHRCAAGFAYLTFCPELEQQSIKQELIGNRLTSLSSELNDEFFDTFLPMVQSVGFARIDLPDYRERSLAAPVRVGGITIGALQLRYIVGSLIDWRKTGALLVKEADGIGRSVADMDIKVGGNNAQVTSKPLSYA